MLMIDRPITMVTAPMMVKKKKKKMRMRMMKLLVVNISLLLEL